MAFYRLVYNGEKGQVKLPSTDSLRLQPEDPDNRRLDPELLENFARKQGHESFDWDSVDLVKIKEPENPVDAFKWDRFQAALDKHEPLFNYGWNVFKRRIDSDLLHAIVDDDDNVISTISIVPKLTSSLKTILKVPKNTEPQIYESGAAYITQEYRSHDVYTKLRVRAMEEVRESESLVMNQTLGKGASSVNSKLGWNLVNWQEFPFAAMLMGWKEESDSLSGKFWLSAGAKVELPENGLYVGKTLNTGSELMQDWVKGRDWSKNHHWWANDLNKLRELEDLIRIGFDLAPDAKVDHVEHSLNYWRGHIKEALFQDRDLLGNTEAIAAAWRKFEAPARGDMDMGGLVRDPSNDHEPRGRAAGE